MNALSMEQRKRTAKMLRVFRDELEGVARACEEGDAVTLNASLKVFHDSWSVLHDTFVKAALQTTALELPEDDLRDTFMARMEAKYDELGEAFGKRFEAACSMMEMAEFAEGVIGESRPE